MKNIYLLIIACYFVFSCNDNDDIGNIVDGGEIFGGPFTFIVDGTPDMISSITLDGNQFGDQSSWVITDDASDPNIIMLAEDIEALKAIDFDTFGSGISNIWYISHDGSLAGAQVDNTVSQLTGNFSLSNAIEVIRLSPSTISGGPFVFSVDANADMVTEVELNNGYGKENNWLITDNSEDPLIIGVPGNIEAVDFNQFNGGIYQIWYLSHDGNLQGAQTNNRVSQLNGTYVLSNAITVTVYSGGTISGGPFYFAVDGEADMVTAITLNGNQFGTENSWVITDNSEDPKILGLPNDITAVNFDDANSGICLIWYISHDGSLSGADVDNTVSQLSGTFSLSNPISVTRFDAGTISGGPFNFTIDGTPDMVSGITLDGNQFGSNSTWVITNDAEDPKILGLPSDIEALEAVNFDETEPGNCLIWYLQYEGELSGAMLNNTVSQLLGNFDLSNAIIVNRN